MNDVEDVRRELVTLYAAFLYGFVPLAILEDLIAKAGVTITPAMGILSVAFWYTVLGWASRR